MIQQIFLCGNRLDQTYELLQDSFTRIRDRLNILGTEAGRLSSVWQGEAEKEWQRVFEEKREEITVGTEELYKYLLKLKEQAYLLAKTEQEIMTLAEGVC